MGPKKISLAKKNLGPKKFGVLKILWAHKFLLGERFFPFKKIFGSEKVFVSKKKEKKKNGSLPTPIILGEIKKNWPIQL